jgi:methylated-DNA-[protein]-cysteine S-methyltransferase
MTDTDELERALRASPNTTDEPPDVSLAAAAAGVLDVAYATLASPVGELLLAATDTGLVRLAYIDYEDQAGVLEELSRRLSPRVLLAPRRLDATRRELEEYFTGTRSHFDLTLDWSLTRGFGRRVLEATALIPYGAVSTYKQVASDAGSPRGSRAAGNALGANPLPIVVPCHRVLHSSGGLGGYTGGLERKRTLLAVERGQGELEGT